MRNNEDIFRTLFPPPLKPSGKAPSKSTYRNNFDYKNFR